MHAPQEVVLGRIIASITITNVADESKSLRCDALVDTGSSLMVLPNEWKGRLGDLEAIRTVELETATQETVTGEVRGPVRLPIAGFKPGFGGVLFVQMKPADR